MKIVRYGLSISLVIWGLLIAWFKFLTVGPHFPFLTLLTIVALFAGIDKNKKADLIFLVTSCLWILLSAETIGFVFFFDPGHYEKMVFGIIPLFLGSGLLFSLKIQNKLLNAFPKKLLLITILAAFGIASFVYKPTTEEINCWYYLEEGNSFRVLFAEMPGRTFEVELSSQGLKEEIKAEALKEEGRNGYYCPETQVRVITSFGKITSVKILSFRNTENNKVVTFIIK